VGRQQESHKIRNSNSNPDNILNQEKFGKSDKKLG